VKQLENSQGDFSPAGPGEVVELEAARAARSARGRSAKNRGKFYELQFAKWLATRGWPDARRAVVTGTGDRHDPGDIAGTPGIVWDVKSRTADLARQPAAVMPMLAAVELMRSGEGAAFGFLVERADRTPVERWRVWQPLGQAVRLAGGQPAVFPGPPVSMSATDTVALLHARGYGSPVDPFADSL
jgi:hypothetical protein